MASSLMEGNGVGTRPVLGSVFLKSQLVSWDHSNIILFGQESHK